MNAQMLAQMLNLNPTNTQKLSQAWGQAQQASAGVNSLQSAQKAIKAFGLTSDMLSQAGSMLNSPLAGVVASALGTDINKARNAFNKLTGTSGTVSTPSTSSFVDDLAKLKAGLQQLKS